MATIAKQTRTSSPLVVKSSTSVPDTLPCSTKNGNDTLRQIVNGLIPFQTFWTKEYDLWYETLKPAPQFGFGGSTMESGSEDKAVAEQAY
jgi:hypothetical protein